LVALFSNAPFPGFVWRFSSVRFSARCLFGQVRLARSHIICVALPGFGNGIWYRPVFTLLMLSFLTGPADSSRVRVRALPLRFSAIAPGSGMHRHPPPPNNSFKPTPCRGIGRVLYATLAHVRRPAKGRLNSGVRRHPRKLNACCCKSHRCSCRNLLPVARCGCACSTTHGT
jgi:hypothetical protein